MKISQTFISTIMFAIRRSFTAGSTRGNTYNKRYSVKYVLSRFNFS